VKSYKYYRVDKTGTELCGELVVDETIYIEYKKDKLGRDWYWMCEDFRPFTKKINKFRIPAYAAKFKIHEGLFQEKL
jgi:hypothetical protein